MHFRSPAIPLLLALWSGPFLSRADDFVDGEVLVSFKPHVALERAHTALGRHSLTMKGHFRGISTKAKRVSGLVCDKGRTTARLIAELKADNDVEAVEPNYIRHIAAVTPNDTDFAKLWALQNSGQSVNGTPGVSGVDTDFSAAWKLARPATGEVVVGVADTGVDVTHPDLKANIWVNAAEVAGNGIDDDGNGFRDDVSGYDFASNTGTVTDSGSHGTHVAGTIAAVGRNGAGMIGVQFKAKILPLQVSADGDSMPTSAVLAAYDYAIDLKQRGVNIVAINASFGGTSRTVIEHNAVQALHDAGIVLCAAAGNEGTNNDATPFYPASFPVPNVISVAALTPGNALAGFSNYGALTVDLAAPGTEIYSAQPLREVEMTGALKLGATTYSVSGITFSGATAAAGLSGAIHYCGLGRPEEFTAAVSGNIALIQRGSLTFGEKVSNAMNAGAVAAILYDNTTATLASAGWTLGASRVWIPAVQVTMATGEALRSRAPAAATVTAWRDTALAYKFQNGTSMAAPHVSGAVAFAALNFPLENVTKRIARIMNHVTPVAALANRTTTGGRLNLLNIVDTDRDGLPDWWEVEHFASLAPAPADDPDKDKFPNADEYLAATNPVSAASYLAFTSVSQSSGGAGHHLVLTFPGVPDRTYQIEWSPNMKSNTWAPLGGPIPGTGDGIQVTDPGAFGPAQPSRFYRLRMLAE